MPAADPLPVTPARPFGVVWVVGLGPGDEELRTPRAAAVLAAATDVVGYHPYVAMVAERAGQHRHPSDNRVEAERARAALDLAAAGGRVAVVSSGDPGVFAMATAVLEQLDPAVNPDAEQRWGRVDVEIVPGVTAATATAALAGAPLGHDFCLISLSDVLKPWDVVERRVAAAAGADFVLAFYNPISRHRPWQLGRAMEVVAEHRRADTPVVLGRDVGRPDQSVRVVPLGTFDPAAVDMRTTVIVGSSTTRAFTRPDPAGGPPRTIVWTPRRYPG